MPFLLACETSPLAQGIRVRGRGHDPRPHLRSRLARFTGRTTVPYVFVDGRPVGGFAEIKALHRSGALDRLARGEV